MQLLLNCWQDIFVDIERIVLKFICKGKGTRIAKTILKRIKREKSVNLISRLYQNSVELAQG
jgi:hypothetical protein